jgi:acyl-CoA thioesterase-1
VFASFRILFLSVVASVLALSHAHAKETNVILLFGDSIIAGYGLKAEESVPVRLQELLRERREGVTVINGGVSGDTTGAGRSRLEWTLDKHKPDLVVLALGGNDVLRGIPPEVTGENLAAMLELLKKRNIPTILSAVNAPANLGEAYRKQFDAIYTDAAKRYNVPLYPFLIGEFFGQNAFMQADGIHPNADGARNIATNLARYLEDSPLYAKPRK